jgi:hypothetical protein
MKTNIVTKISLIFLVSAVLTFFCQCEVVTFHSERTAKQSSSSIKKTSPLFGLLKSKIIGNTVYCSFNLEMAKKEFKADKIYLVTTLDSSPKEITGNSFKVNLHEGFSFITGSGFENMFFSWNNGNKANNKNVYHINFNNGQTDLINNISNTYKVYLEDGKAIL